VNGPRIGSLCTGAGGLDQAAAAVTGGTLAWVSEIAPGPVKVLAHHYPDVPNLGDLTAIDWTAAEPVDVLTAGYPCPPFSQAGKRLGVDDERHLWPWIIEGIRVLRPRLVLLENVRGHLTLGLTAVLADLDRAGYDTRWTVLTASAVGACHERARLFIAATPRGAWVVPAGDPCALLDEAGWAAPNHALFGDPDLIGAPPASGATSGGVMWATEPPRATDTPTHLLLTPTAQLAINGGSQHPDKRKAGGHSPTLADQVEYLLPTVTAADAGSSGGSTPSDVTLTDAVVRTECGTIDNPRHLLPTPTAVPYGNNQSDSPGASVRPPLWALTPELWPGRWGRYAAAVARHEATFGTPAPSPTEPGKNGPRLNRALPAWMMCLPQIVATPGLTRNQVIEVAGNGCVPAQAEAAFRTLLLGASVVAA